jgi:hypothetical protein
VFYIFDLDVKPLDLDIVNLRRHKAADATGQVRCVVGHVDIKRAPHHGGTGENKRTDLHHLQTLCLLN